MPDVEGIEEVVELKLAGLYLIDAGSAQFGVGGGVFSAWSGADIWYFVEASANIAVGGNTAIYGTIDYNITTTDITYKAGASLTF